MKPAPMTDEQIDEAFDAARSAFKLHMSKARGQQIMPPDGFDWHFARAIEAARDQQWVEMLETQEKTKESESVELGFYSNDASTGQQREVVSEVEVGMNKGQPDALRLADELKKFGADSSLVRHQAANELHRLHAENEALREALRELVKVCETHDRAIAEVIGKPTGWKDRYLEQARAALARAGETK